MRIRRTAPVIALALIASACAAGTPPAARAPSPSTAPSPATSPSVAASPLRRTLPAVRVVDLATDARVDVSLLSPSATPLLVWFWAPT